MGLLNEIIGVVVAEEALDKADPNAGFLKKGMAAIAGFEGEKVIEEKLTQPGDAQQAAADSGNQ